MINCNDRLARKSLHYTKTMLHLFPPKNVSVSFFSCLQCFRGDRFHPCVCDFEVTVGVQKDLNGARRLTAVLQNLYKKHRGNGGEIMEHSHYILGKVLQQAPDIIELKEIK